MLINPDLGIKENSQLGEGLLFSMVQMGTIFQSLVRGKIEKSWARFNVLYNDAIRFSLTVINEVIRGLLCIVLALITLLVADISSVTFTLNITSTKTLWPFIVVSDSTLKGDLKRKWN